MMIFRETFDNRMSKPTRIETDHICEIMNTSIVGWKPGATARFAEYGTQRSWVYVNEDCKRDTDMGGSENVQCEFVEDVPW